MMAEGYHGDTNLVKQVLNIVLLKK